MEIETPYIYIEPQSITTQNPKFKSSKTPADYMVHSARIEDRIE